MHCKAIMVTTQKTFHDFLREQIDKSNSMRAFALKAGIAQGTISQWLSTGRKPSMRLSKRLAKSLKTDLSVIRPDLPWKL